MSTFFGRWLTRKKRGKFSLVGVCLYIVDPKNKSTFSTHPVGEDCILASLECLINSKLYHKGTAT